MSKEPRPIAAWPPRSHRAYALRGSRWWWDQDGIAWGKDWIEVLQTEITDCRGFLILIGERGIGGWVKAELGLAPRRHFEQGLALYALLLPGVREAALPPFLSLGQAKRLPEPPPDEAEFRELARTLAGDGDRDALSDAIDPDLCPYPGLESFGEETARFFFGRQAETIEVLGLPQEH